MRKTMLMAALVMALPTLAQAQSATADVTATVISALTLDATADVDFGTVQANAGTVTLAPNTAAGAGVFEAAGQENASIIVTYPSSALLERVGGSESLTFTPSVTGATTVGGRASAASVANNSSVTLSSTGAYVFWLGGSITVTGAVSGTYEGEFTMTIDYN